MTYEMMDLLCVILLLGVIVCAAGCALCYKMVRDIARTIDHLEGACNTSKEKRCPTCIARNSCPAYNTGVIYPCPYYKGEE